MAKWVEISDAWVKKIDGGNDTVIEVGDIVKFYIGTPITQYVEGKVKALPHTTLSNLDLFKNVLLP